MTWLMMALEGPYLAAIVARLPEPKANLAAHGVALAMAIMIEAPVIMIMAAATTLVRDREAFVKLRNFTHAMNAAITFFMAGLLATPGMDFLTQKVIGLPPEVARLVWGALVILLPWPAAIGYRRFYQGVLIRNGQTRRVAYGTAIRLGTMSATAFLLYHASAWPGAWVGASALTAGVCLEAAVARIMAVKVTRGLLAQEKDERDEANATSYRLIAKYYFPLALTSTVSLAVHPMVTFFVGQGRMPLESLAVIPVVNGLVFCFRALGLSYQEAAIALIGDRDEHYRAVRGFALRLALFASFGLGLIAFTPLSTFWFESLSGLSPALAEFALLPTKILCAIPALSVLLSLQRAMLMKARRTAAVSLGTFVEVTGVLAVLFFAIEGIDMVGAVAAALSLLLGRIAGNLYLLRPCSQLLARDPAKSGC